MTERLTRKQRQEHTRLCLLEAAGRGMWAQPEQATLDGLRQVLLETEGELEG